MSPPTKTQPLEGVSLEELEAIVEQTRSSALNDEQYGKLKGAVETLAHLCTELAGKKASIRRLRKLVFGPKSERSRKVLRRSEGGKADGGNPGAESSVGQGGTAPANGAGEEGPQEQPEKKKRKGHGRRAADEYTGAQRIHVPHESLGSGDPCRDPLCAAQGGKVYPMKDPATRRRVLGQAALLAVIYLLERLRCHLCGTIYTAKLPEGVGEERFDETAIAMMALLRYGFGFPLHRLERLQDDLGNPLPASTQWEAVSEAVPAFVPVFEELIRQAARGTNVHNDDTNMLVLQLLKENREREKRGDAPGRTGVFTSSIVSVNEDIRIALFFTGRNHAGENLGRVLGQRPAELGPAIQMCDAASRNVSPEFETIVCNCVPHARRQYVDVVEDFPDECRVVLEILAKVFKNDATAREQNLTPQERLEFHRKESKRLMAQLRLWMYRQLKERRVEPNSGLGRAIAYTQKHWRKLTRFLFVPGAAIDNNIAERMLKTAITHRKNSLFYKTANGARVGDLFMSIIATCQLVGANPFDYLTEVLRNKEAVARDPARWMPWNYRATLERLKGAGPDPPTGAKGARKRGTTRAETACAPRRPMGASLHTPALSEAAAPRSCVATAGS